MPEINTNTQNMHTYKVTVFTNLCFCCLHRDDTVVSGFQNAIVV